MVDTEAAALPSEQDFPYLDHDLIDEWRDGESPDPAFIRACRSYVEGVHGDTLTADQRKLLSAVLEHETADNVVRLIIRAAASRLKLEAFDVLAPVDENGVEVEAESVTRLRAWIQRYWIVNQWERLQYENAFAFLRDGNSALSLSWRVKRNGTGDVRVSRETWWDGKTGVFVAYDADGDELWAAKEFEDRDPLNPKEIITRRTVYYPDRFVRYVKDGKGWKEFTSDGKAAEQPWVKLDGSPLGIPIIHFRNGASVTDSWYGQSDLVGLLGFQDDLNNIQHDITAAAMFSGFQTITGVGIDNPRAIKRVPGGFMSTPKSKTEAGFDVLPPGDMSQLTSTHAYKRQTMAINASTPVHGIETQNLHNVAGVTLLRAEMPFIDKIEQLGAVAGPRYTMTTHRATEIANAFGRAGLDEGIPITSLFDSAMRIDEETQAQIAKAKADAWAILSRLPLTAMIEAGVDEATAKKIAEEREMDALSVERFLNAGGLDPVPGGE